MPQVLVKRLVVGDMGVNCYVVTNAETQECLIVDPGADAERIVFEVGQSKPVAVLLTHAHFDHIGCVDDICRRYSIPVYVHKADATKLADAWANVSAGFGAHVTQSTPPTLLPAEGTLTLAGMPLTVLHTPGHSAGSVCYLLPEGQGLLSGDTLFAHGYGRTDFPDGDFAALRQSLRTLFRLTPPMPLYPGHDVLGTVGREPVRDD